MPETALEALPGIHAFGRPAPGALALDAAELGFERGDDRRHDLVLHGEDVLEIAVVAFGPEMVAGCGLDQLRGDAHPRAGLAHAALQDVGHAQTDAHILHVDRLALERERGVAGDDKERTEA